MSSVQACNRHSYGGRGRAGNWGSTKSLWFCLCFVLATSENMGEGTVEKLVRI